MTATSFSTTRRDFLAITAATGTATLLPGTLQAASGGDAIHPFNARIPQADVDELRRRIVMTRWPDRETIDDRSQSAPLAKLQELLRYWGTDYDWRKGEAKLNAFPQFTTEIDELGIHFIHVRSPHKGALP